MKIVIAMDSFKGSMTSMEAGKAAEEGILKVMPDAQVIVKPLADGGEGTMNALADGLGGEIISAQVGDPLGRRIVANYAEVTTENGQKTAVIEMAQAAGLTLLAESERNPYKTTTYGVGELINHAIERGCRDFLIGIGGSATNDGGMGMLRALGYRFLDSKEQEISTAENLRNITRICDCNARKELKECTFQIACDVTNPLCGENGATYVYGLQKGLAEGNLEAVDKAMASYADAVTQFTGKDDRNVPGAGAAGGMGFAFVSFFDAKLLPGAELVMQATGLEKSLQGADFFLTGEGRIDAQTAMGKAPMAAAQKAKHINPKCRTIAFAGQVMPGAENCVGNGMDEIHAITPEGMAEEQAMQKETAKKNMLRTVKEKMIWVYRL